MKTESSGRSLMGSRARKQAAEKVKSRVQSRKQIKGAETPELHAELAVSGRRSSRK